MFLRFWRVSTIICTFLFFSSSLILWRELNKEFTKEELKKHYKNNRGGYAWYINVFIFVCPILNILFILAFGFNYKEIKEKQFRDIRRTIGKQTTADVVSEVFDKLLSK